MFPCEFFPCGREQNYIIKRAPVTLMLCCFIAASHLIWYLCKFDELICLCKHMHCVFFSICSYPLFVYCLFLLTTNWECPIPCALQYLSVLAPCVLRGSVHAVPTSYFPVKSQTNQQELQ